MRRAVILAALVAALLAVPARADELDAEQYELFGAGEVDASVPDSARDAIGDAGIADALEPEDMFGRLWDALLEKLDGLWSGAAAAAVKLIAIAALVSACSAFANESTRRYVSMAGCLAVAAAAFGDAGEWISAGAEAIEDISEFSHALLPCLTATAAAGGMAASAAARYAATSLFMDVFITLSKSLLLPMAYAMLALRTAAAALGSDALDGAGKLIKWLCGVLTAAVMTAFTLYLSLSGAVTGAADALTSKAAKTAISAALPVVGGIISDAAGTLVAGAGLLRSAVGAFGAVVIAGICLAPFLALGMRYLLYKAASALAGCFADKPIAGLIGDVGSAFAMVLGVTGACAAMLFISVISAVKAVSG